MYKSRLGLVLIGCLVTFIAAAKDHPYDAKFVALVHAMFLENGQVSEPKLQAYAQRIKQKRDELTQIVRNQLIAEDGAAPDEARSEALEHKFIFALNRSLENLPDLRAARSTRQIYDQAKELLDIEAAIRIEGASAGLPSVIAQVRHYSRRWVIRKKATPETQASNLFKDGSFLSPDDLRVLKAQGSDISLLDPGPGSTFWQPQKNIAQIDMKDAARGRTLQFYEGPKPRFPDEDVYIFEEIKLSDTKPKMDVHALDDEGKKIKFKLKFGAEINADPTVSAIMMALGYPADMTKTVRNVRVILGKHITLSDVKREWENYYRRDSTRKLYKIEDYLAEHGTDAEGNNFLVFKEGLLEAKPKKIERLGGWSWGDFGHSSLREVRALSLINMWLDNTDLKEFENNRLLIREDGDPRRPKLAHIVSDLGHSLGSIFLEMPELFSTKMVHSTSPDFLTIKYRSFHPSAIKNQLTYDDARWATRLMASLSRQQIKAAVELGKWPKCMERIYVEKLISRRNDLIKHLNLVGVPDMNGQKIELQTVDLRDSTINFDLVCDTAALERDYTSNYDFDMGFLLRPIGQTALRGLLDMARGTLNDTRHMTLSHAELGFDESVIAQVIFNVSRTYEKNPSPSSEQDLFLFQDHVEVGMRLGYSYGLYKDAIYSRRFTLSYPARSIEEGRLRDNFIANIFLPLDIAKQNLPEKYVLMTEHYWESGFGLEIDNLGHTISPTIRARQARVLLLRSFLDHRVPGQYLVYRDRAKHTQNSLQLFARIALLKLPLMETLRQWGGSVGVGMRLTADEAETPAAALKLQQAMIQGNFSALQDAEAKFRLNGSFNASGTGWDLLFWRGHSDSRLERIRVYDAEEHQRRDSLQYRTRRDRSWSFLGSKEKREFSVEAFTAPLMDDPAMHVNVVVRGFDTSVTDKEMENNYLFFINGISADGTQLIPLSISLGYSTNGRWGPLVLQSHTTYYHEALQRILKVTKADLQVALIQSRQSLTPESNGNENTLSAKLNLVWSKIQLARQQKTPEGRLKAITNIFNKAVYRREGFYEPRLLGALNRIAGLDNIYSAADMAAPDFREQNFINEAPLYGQQGKERTRYYDYMMYAPVTPSDLFFMFDFWR